MTHEPPEEVPDFADRDPVKRLRWTEMIIGLHHSKIEMLAAKKKQLAAQGLGKRQLAHFDTRALATRNSLRSWEVYKADGCPRDPRAPAILKISQYV